MGLEEIDLLFVGQDRVEKLNEFSQDNPGTFERIEVVKRHGVDDHQEEIGVHSEGGENVTQEKNVG